MLSLGSVVTMHIVQEAQDLNMQDSHYVLRHYSGTTQIRIRVVSILGCVGTELKYYVSLRPA